MVRKLAAIVSRAMRILPVVVLNTALNICSRSRITGDGECVVSLTTYSSRTRYVFLTIESIAKGTVKPRRLILWIDDPSLMTSLPRTLRRLAKRGLEIRGTSNYGPHKKYYSYVCSESAFVLPLVTADDDILYPPYWLEGLLSSYEAFPTDISCYRAHRMSITHERIDPYRVWKSCNATEPSYKNFSTGASGALYPPEMLVALKSQGTEFMEIAPRADDVWLHATAVRHGFRTRQIREASLEFPVIPGTQGLALSRQNVVRDGNDVQIQRAYDARTINVLSADS